MVNKNRTPTSTTTFLVTKVGAIRQSQRGAPYIDCRSDQGIVAFWGSELDSDNIERIQGARTPFRVTCEAFAPNSTKYAFWVPQVPSIIELVELQPETPLPAPSNAQDVLSADDLSRMRRVLMQVISALDSGKAQPNDNVAFRIRRLVDGRKIPREIAPLMRTITEMRNTAEYEAKVLSLAESQAVASAWRAIQEWAERMGLKIGQDIAQ